MLPEGLYTKFLSCRTVCTDTRNIIPGSIFFALKGANFDGNSYAVQALEEGCIAAVVDDSSLEKYDSLFLVDDVLTCMQELAHKYRESFNFPVLGITGSNGKTTSKELIRDVLKMSFKVHATKGNLNNHIGVPLTLLSIPEDCNFAIIEMGANHQLEIRDLSNICDPDFGFITNIGKAHLEGFGGPEGVKKGKKELFDHIKNKDGLVFVNSSIPHLTEISEGITQILFGSESDDQFFSIQTADPTLTVKWHRKGKPELIIETQLAGAYNLSNIASAVVIGNYFKVSEDKIQEALEAYSPDNNRSQWIKTESNRIIMDAYNANPSSMTEAIKNLKIVGKESAIAILGDMKEMGQHANEEHLKLIQELAQLKLEAILIGNDFSKVYANQPCMKCFQNLEEAKEHIRKHPLKSRTILLKGSRSMQLEGLKELL